ncbi:hypothetical protein KQI38_00150 [Tissierella carlieri]|uniref:hypothetical protein n=1 Tax=Tissierella carlieri TaxID=689904 RepID=UPI001C11D32A|nr:hypothetical protein [Tissierella carlieri]MBU5310427.1 hypothetical protein [Tissierella carlieri]
MNEIIIEETVGPYSRFSFLFMVVAIVTGVGFMYFLSGLVLKPAKRLATDILSIDRACYI